MSPTCSECGNDMERLHPNHNMCETCSFNIAMANFDGEFRRGSDLDRI